MIQSEEADLEAHLRFHFSDETFEVAKGLVLGLKGEAPRVRGLVICEGDGEMVAVDGGGLDWTDEVTMDLFDGELRTLRVVLRGIVGPLFRLASQAACAGLGVQGSGIEFDAENWRVRSSGMTGCLQRLIVHVSHPLVPKVGGQGGFSGVERWGSRAVPVHRGDVKFTVPVPVQCHFSFRQLKLMGLHV